MKPYPQRGLTRQKRIYNYRLSRARRIVENAFGILTNRWRCLLSTMAQTTNRIKSVTLACCVLHNLLWRRRPGIPSSLIDTEDPATHLVNPGLWRDGDVLLDIQNLTGNNATHAAKEQREHLLQYYNSPAGAVPWQDNIVG